MATDGHDPIEANRLFVGIGPALQGWKQGVASATYNCALGPFLWNGGMIFESVGFADPVN
jgi:hypothetical protein